MAMIGMLIVLVFLLLIVLTAGIAIGLFVWRDAKRRNMNAAAWTLLAVILPCFIWSRVTDIQSSIAPPAAKASGRALSSAPTAARN